MQSQARRQGTGRQTVIRRANQKKIEHALEFRGWKLPQQLQRKDIDEITIEKVIDQIMTTDRNRMGVAAANLTVKHREAPSLSNCVPASECVAPSESIYRQAKYYSITASSATTP